MNRVAATWALAVLLAVVTACLMILSWDSIKAIYNPPPGPLLPLPWEEGYTIPEEIADEMDSAVVRDQYVRGYMSDARS